MLDMGAQQSIEPLNGEYVLELIEVDDRAPITSAGYFNRELEQLVQAGSVIEHRRGTSERADLHRPESHADAPQRSLRIRRACP